MDLSKLDSKSKSKVGIGGIISSTSSSSSHPIKKVEEGYVEVDAAVDQHPKPNYNQSEAAEQEFVEVEEVEPFENEIGEETSLTNFDDEVVVGNEEMVEFLEYPITHGTTYKMAYRQRLPRSKTNEKREFFTSRRIKQGLDEGLYYRMPLIKGNTKYAMYYDRLINADGSSTEHYICKNYERCGKIFHRRYLDALCTHMAECRPENLWNNEECSDKTITNLIVNLIIRDPNAFEILQSKAYLEYIEELSRIMVMRYSIGLTIGKDALPRPKDLLREIIKYSFDDEHRQLPLSVQEAFTNECAVETLVTRIEPCSQITLTTHINNQWEIVRTIFDFCQIDESTLLQSSSAFLNTLITEQGMQFITPDKFYVVSEYDEEDSRQIYQPCIIHFLEQIVDKIVFNHFDDAITNLNDEHMLRLRSVLNRLKIFVEKARQHPRLRILFPISTTRDYRLSLLGLVRNWLISLNDINNFFALSTSQALDSLRIEHSILVTRENIALFNTYVAIFESFEEAIQIFESTINGPTSNMIIVELTELANRMETFTNTKELDNLDQDTLYILANLALSALKNDFENINKNLAFCALYCDPLRFGHANYLSRFCTVDKVRSAVFLELENMETTATKHTKTDETGTSTSWLSYTEEANHYEQLTMDEIFDVMEINGIARDPQHYCPLAFWRTYENVYPSIARLAKRVLAVSASLAGSEQVFEQFKPLANALSTHFDSKSVSRLIRLHSIHRQIEKKTRHLNKSQKMIKLGVNLDEQIELEKIRTKRKTENDEMTTKTANDFTMPKKRGRPRKEQKFSQSVKMEDKQTDADVANVVKPVEVQI